MNAETLHHLQEFEAAAETARRLWPEIVPADDRDRRTALHAGANAWDAIDDALDLLYALESAETTPPLALRRWLRGGWKSVVLAADAAVAGDMTPADLDSMDTDEIRDQLIYLSDFQG